MSTVARPLADMQLCRGEERIVQFRSHCNIRLVKYLVMYGSCLPQVVSVDANMVHKLLMSKRVKRCGR